MAASLDVLVRYPLIAAIVHCTLYGIFFVLAITSTYLMVIRRRRDLTYSNGRPPSSISSLNIPIIYGTIILFLTLTTNWILSLVRLFETFDDGNPSAVKFIRNFGSPLELAETLFLALTVLVGDLIIIYRMWVIWSHNKLVVVFPLLLICGFTASVIGTLVSLSRFHRGQSVFFSRAGKWGMADAVITLVINIYCTVMIAFQLRSINSQLKKNSFASAISLSSLLSIVVESALVYTMWTLVYFIMYVTGHNAAHILEEGASAIVGIASTLIGTRVGLGWASPSQGDVVDCTAVINTAVPERGVGSTSTSTAPLESFGSMEEYPSFSERKNSTAPSVQ